MWGRKVEIEVQKDCRDENVLLQVEERVEQMEGGGCKAAVQGGAEVGGVETGACEVGEDQNDRVVGTWGHLGQTEALA